jgi:hypothetical protein
MWDFLLFLENLINVNRQINLYIRSRDMKDVT